jgi:hypothetical protein
VPQKITIKSSIGAGFREITTARTPGVEKVAGRSGKEYRESKSDRV